MCITNPLKISDFQGNLLHMLLFSQKCAFYFSILRIKKGLSHVQQPLFLHIRLLAHPACKEPIRFVTRRVKHLAMLADALRVEPGVQPALVSACSL